MPAPSTPTQKEILQDILLETQAQTVAINNLEAVVAGQAEMIEISANFLRLLYESNFGADLSASGIWDGSDRYV
jgi:hypothetical protein